MVLSNQEELLCNGASFDCCKIIRGYSCKNIFGLVPSEPKTNQLPLLLSAKLLSLKAEIKFILAIIRVRLVPLGVYTKQLRQLATLIKELHSRDSVTTLFFAWLHFLRVLDICAACNYPTRNPNFKSQISDSRLKSVSFHFIFFFFFFTCGPN